MNLFYCKLSNLDRLLESTLASKMKANKDKSGGEESTVL